MTNASLPAYPTPNYETHQGTITAQRGLSKREAFAMAAMQGLLPVCGCDPLLIERCAEYSVHYADALLAELAKAQP